MLVTQLRKQFSLPGRSNINNWRFWRCWLSVDCLKLMYQSGWTEHCRNVHCGPLWFSVVPVLSFLLFVMIETVNYSTPAQLCTYKITYFVKLSFKPSQTRTHLTYLQWKRKFKIFCWRDGGWWLYVMLCNVSIRYRLSCLLLFVTRQLPC